MAGIESPFVKVRRRLVMARIEFMSQLAAFQPEDLSRSLTAEGESPLLIAHHLATIEVVALQQLQRIQSEDNPHFDTLLQLLPVETELGDAVLSLDSVLVEMSDRRSELLSYLSQAPLSNWERPFVFASWGSRKFYQLVNMLPLHDRQHARQLATMRAHLS
ncbi:hypothetical protein KDH_50430 [Dictyobacter sp. S3.2.2.5]|uniref:DinB-like domain-containing protein n=1 Tax=Dictyobacter halimunensis TaxID=3026934 RepID=A0ABQ6FVB4_9CHLR|nr:hypothetical protein KDH_50430 [Dictyobacter sp. S3.2.2.5]